MSALLRVAELDAAYSATIDVDKLEAGRTFLSRIAFTRSPLRRITGLVMPQASSMPTRVQCGVTGSQRCTANIYERQSHRHIVGLPVLNSTG